MARSRRQGACRVHDAPIRPRCLMTEKFSSPEDTTARLLSTVPKHTILQPEPFLWRVRWALRAKGIRQRYCKTGMSFWREETLRLVKVMAPRRTPRNCMTLSPENFHRQTT